MLKLYGLKKCTTCQKAVKWLDENKVKNHFSDVREEPVTKEQVARWSKSLGGWEKLLNRGGFTWRGLSEPERENLSEAKAVALATKYPALIRRPLIEHADGSVTVGFSKKIQEVVK